MKYFKYYLILGALISVFTELFAEHFSHIDYGMIGLTASPFVIIYATLSCGASCRRVDRRGRYYRS